MRYREIIDLLKSLSNPEAVEGMARFGINPKGTLGVSIPNLRKIAKAVGKDHEMASHLWKSGIHEARLLAGFIDDPALVTLEQMEQWVSDFDSWDICDQACSNLFDRTPFAHEKAIEWPGRQEEFVKRAGFVLMAALAVHDKAADENKFKKFLSLIKRESSDERNFVKKAVNWALRQIGKRNARLNRLSLKTAAEIQKLQSKSARWIAADAIRELESEAVQRRLGKESIKEN
jgi:3-methyladenine DNA glycosylase AlkD